MNERDLEIFEKKYTSSILQLQESLTDYFHSIEKLAVAINDHTELETPNKKQLKNQTIATLATLTELQNILYKKMQVLMKTWGLKQEDVDVLEKKINVPKIANIKEYRIAKKPTYHTSVKFKMVAPNPPWKSPMLKKNRRS